jgi:hypothetical protein
MGLLTMEHELTPEIACSITWFRGLLPGSQRVAFFLCPHMGVEERERERETERERERERKLVLLILGILIESWRFHL